MSVKFPGCCYDSRDYLDFILVPILSKPFRNSDSSDIVEGWCLFSKDLLIPSCFISHNGSIRLVIILTPFYR